MAIGSFVLVLHGHLPYVIHHGRWPHGEVWLYEAAAETWLPMLDLVDACTSAGLRAPVTLGLTPILLEQLAHPRFKVGFPAFLGDQRERALRDADDFTAQGNTQFAWLARCWVERLDWQLQRFEDLGRDLVGAFARHWQAGTLELLGSSATHGYSPLLQQDRSIRAQLRVGLATSQRHLGRRPEAIWLPECGWRSGGPWTSPVLGGGATTRLGLDQLLAEAGVRLTFVEHATLQGCRSEGVRDGGAFHKVAWSQRSWDAGRAWGSPLEAHVATSTGQDGAVAVFARHPQVSEQVWSGRVGYPGDGRYLEFHKRHGDQGLRYWRVTDNRTDLGGKQPYDPPAAHEAARSHASHMVQVLRATLRGHRQRTGRQGVAVACFDAELFGHWWHEGVYWMQELLLQLQAGQADLPEDERVELRTASEALEAHPADKVVWLPEGSWGADGDHHVWLNPVTRWTWEVEHRAEQRLGWLLDELPHRDGTARARRIRTTLTQAARELLLLQASDWQFVIHTEGAVDYGFKRLALHAERFERLCNLAQDLAAGLRPDATQRAAVAEVQAHDDVFAHLDLSAWDP